MIQLIYVSFSEGVVNKEIIKDIIDSSKKNNPALDVTGILLYSGGVYFQLLEGPEKSTLSLFEKIKKDPRHSDCEILGKTPTNTRLFEDWSMDNRELSDLDLDVINTVLPWSSLASSSERKEIPLYRAIEMLESFKAKVIDSERS